MFGPIPVPWSGKMSRAGSRRFAGAPDAANPGKKHNWDFDESGNCLCARTNGEEWCAIRVCCI